MYTFCSLLKVSQTACSLLISKNNEFNNHFLLFLSCVLQNIKQVLGLFDNGYELFLRDGAIWVLIKLFEQLFCFGHICRGTNHLVHCEYSSEIKKSRKVKTIFSLFIGLPKLLIESELDSAESAFKDIPFDDEYLVCKRHCLL